MFAPKVAAANGRPAANAVPPGPPHGLPRQNLRTHEVVTRETVAVARHRVGGDACLGLSAATCWTGGRGGDRRVNAGDRGTDRVCATLERLGGAEIVLTPKRRARFLHCLLDSRDLIPRRRQNIVCELGGLRGFEASGCRCERGRDFGEQAFGAAARGRAAGRGLAGGALGSSRLSSAWFSASR